MGAIIALILVLGTLTACMGGAAADIKGTLPASMDIPETITYTVEVEEHEHIVCDEDGTQLVVYRHEVPVLQAVRSDGSEVEEARSPVEEQALETVAVFNEQFADWTGEEHLRELAGYARADRSWLAETGVEWEDTRTYTETLSSTVYQTEQMVSISASCDSYTGGAHPNRVLMGWNFDLTTGEFFAPEALAADSQEFSDLVAEEIIRQAQIRASEEGMEPEAFFWEDYREIAADWGSYAVSFDETGMTVGYSPYEMACYAAGPQEFTLSYEQLLPGLSDHGKEILGLAEEA